MPQIKPEIDCLKWKDISVSSRNVSKMAFQELRSTNREGLVLLTSDVLMVTNSLPSFITRHVIIASKGLVFISIINAAASFWRRNIYRCSWFAFKDVLFVKNNSDVFPEFRLYSLCQFAWQFFYIGSTMSAHVGNMAHHCMQTYVILRFMIKCTSRANRAGLCVADHGCINTAWGNFSLYFWEIGFKTVVCQKSKLYFVLFPDSLLFTDFCLKTDKRNLQGFQACK